MIWAAVANRRLRFSEIHQLLRYQPTSIIITVNPRKRLYFLKSGHDRDLFVESFHKKYGAKAYGPETA